MNTSFFLTRQTANLMEDFVRELTSSSAFYLLYGAAGVGKSRLLLELMKRRLSDRRAVLIDLSEGNFGGEQQLHEVVAKAEPGTILILDQFDRASNKTRHAVFREWSVEGPDKQLNFIVASREDDFNEFRQLSQQYRSSVQSFQLLPFNADEVQAFLAFYLFDNNPLATVEMPSALRRQLKNANGVVGEVIKLADREKNNISQQQGASSAREQRKAGYLLAALIVVGAAGLSLWFLGNWAGSQSTAVQTAEAAVPAAQSSAEISEVDSSAVSVQPGVRQVNPSGERKPASAALVTETSELEQPSSELADSSLSAGESVAAGEQTTAAVVKTPDEAVASPEAQSSSADQVLASPFARLLSGSAAWIDANAGSMGTIQIMSLGYQQFSEANFAAYLQRLENTGIDVSQIRIFQTRVRGSDVYTVTYGEYANRAAAQSAIAQLPNALRVNGPIPRTLAGIAGELTTSVN